MFLENRISVSDTNTFIKILCKEQQYCMENFNTIVCLYLAFVTMIFLAFITIIYFGICSCIYTYFLCILRRSYDECDNETTIEAEINSQVSNEREINIISSNFNSSTTFSENQQIESESLAENPPAYYESQQL